MCQQQQLTAELKLHAPFTNICFKLGHVRYGRDFDIVVLLLQMNQNDSSPTVGTNSSFSFRNIRGKRPHCYIHQTGLSS